MRKWIKVGVDSWCSLLIVIEKKGWMEISKGKIRLNNTMIRLDRSNYLLWYVIVEKIRICYPRKVYICTFMYICVCIMLVPFTALVYVSTHAYIYTYIHTVAQCNVQAFKLIQGKESGNGMLIKVREAWCSNTGSKTLGDMPNSQLQISQGKRREEEKFTPFYILTSTRMDI